MDSLSEARRQLDQYIDRINQDNFYGNLEERTRYEDAAYKRGMLSAAIASAEAATRQAEAMERIANFLGSCNIDDVLQWIANRRRN